MLKSAEKLYMVVSVNRGPNIDPQNTIVLVIGTRNGTPNLGKLPY